MSLPHEAMAPEDDTLRPDPARMYDYMLGGDHYLPVDRAAAQSLIDMYPTVGLTAKANRAFLLRAVRAIAEAGVDQFLDIGCGIPHAPNVHDVVREVRPGAKVVYVDASAVVLERIGASGPPEGVVGVQADLRDSRTILEAAGRVLDLSRPVGLLLVAVLHFIREDEDIEGMIAALRDGLAPGSHLAMSVACADEIPQDKIEFGKAAYQGATRPIRPFPGDRIRGWFEGWDVLPPGLVQPSLWRPETDDPPYMEAREEVVGAAVLRA
ncbi:SAM-dependent methyltransferase [Spongiactinospora sp. TRM90649]|uniref:SAM-dependent methyltransferase n=1 Tax=Spongiactinospora sp. TRM90649 TaxID=3031114 RepID=UPI0023FA24D5|nr:SAM-dependent methyltransferase [Spongiactinospora sp. TRM90649]MDF5757596.1 SAM-dependent methyltransferase [Spongiactinospora sp. TRM90649]